jgi:SAM-dependent methyltransferase
MVDHFMTSFTKGIPKQAMILDAGAGNKPYEFLFKGNRYHTCDHPVSLDDVYENGKKISHSFFCDLSNMPVLDRKYDYIICTHVLEHAKTPSKIIEEFFRILKPGGKVLLTVPQCFGRHMKPYIFYNFHANGMQQLLEDAGFEVDSIDTIGGIFWLLGKVLSNATLIFWNRFGAFKIVLFPLYFALRTLLFINCFFLFHLDKLDNQKDWTLGYICLGSKKAK